MKYNIIEENEKEHDQTTFFDDFSLEHIFQEFNLFSPLIFGAAQSREGKYVF